jgi:hypothetical protein
VSKKTGTKQYRVVDELKIYHDTRLDRTMPAVRNTRLMVDDKGVANAQPKEMLVHWHTQIDYVDRVMAKTKAADNFLDQSKGAASPAAIKSLNDWADRMELYVLPKGRIPDVAHYSLVSESEAISSDIMGPMRTTTVSGRLLARDKWVQISRKYMVVGRIPPGSTGRSCLLDYATRVLKRVDAVEWVAMFSQAAAADHWLRMTANGSENFLQLTAKQMNDFRNAGGGTAR